MITEYFRKYENQIHNALDSVDQDCLEEFSDKILELAVKKIPLLVCGNGGSAAISEHLSCDHMKGMWTDTDLQPFVIPLASNVALTTAIANDIGYHDIFSKQIEWYPSEAAVLVISSSGNSPNVLKALLAAKSRGMTTMALVGFDGGAAKDLADIVVHVDSNNYGVIEDCHQIIVHAVAQNIRSTYCTNPGIKL